jgi:hypothetical protein
MAGAQKQLPVTQEVRMAEFKLAKPLTSTQLHVMRQPLYQRKLPKDFTIRVSGKKVIINKKGKQVAEAELGGKDVTKIANRDVPDVKKVFGV